MKKTCGVLYVYEYVDFLKRDRYALIASHIKE